MELTSFRLTSQRKNGSRHKKCESCGKTLETEATPKLCLTAATDTHGETVAGGYPVIVTDTLSLFLRLT